MFFTGGKKPQPMTPEMRAECERLFKEAEEFDCRYVAQEIPGSDALGYIGGRKEGDWTITVFRARAVRHGTQGQEIADPDAPVVYDGALRKGTTVVHMTPEVAERIWTKAHAQVTGRT